MIFIPLTITILGFFRPVDMAYRGRTTVADTHEALLTSLLGSYEKRVVPQINDTHPVDLSLGIRLLGLIDLFEHEEIMETFMYLDQMWYDYRLEWDPSKNQRVHVIHIPVDDLWRPDMTVYNNADVDMVSMNTLAIVFSNGQVYYAPKTRIRSRCDMDLTKFPFDTQQCVIKLGSFTFSGQVVNLTLLPVNMTFTDEYMSHKEWSLEEVTSELSITTYACCPEKYQHALFKFRFKRNTVYYMQVFLLPGVILALLVPFQFLLPPDSKERLTLGSCLLLGCILMITLIQSYLPDAHPTLPYLVQYYGVTLIWVSISIICTIGVVNTQSRGRRTRKVPELVKKIFLKTLKKLVCLGDDAYYPLEESEAVSLRSLEKQSVVTHADSPRNAEETKMERDMDEILRHVTTLVMRTAVTDSHCDAHAQWYQVAMVLDRVMCIFFTAIFVIYTCAILG
ncbi:acetylcholine receptor subunit alpha-like isoform X1 [Dreissena polymorpha]|nr:acetylcholine receptor subunit alpha-like isoform X1 [Dreissena polymorpha]